MSLFKKAVFNLSAIALVLAHSAHAIIPSYEPNAPLQAYVYEIDHSGSQAGEVHAFLSNGNYCYLVGAMGAGVGVLSGTWQRAGNDIKLTLTTPKTTIFGIWESTDGQHNVVSVSEFLTFYGFGGQPFLFGFGTDKPTQLALYNHEIHAEDQPIPTGATHVFVGQNFKGKDGYTLTALSLENMTKIPETLKRYGENVDGRIQLSLGATPNMFATANPFLLSQAKANISVHGNALQINGKATQGEKLTDQTDIEGVKHLCSQSPASFAPQLEDNATPAEREVHTLLTPKTHQVHYQGKLDNGTWLKKR